MLHHFYEPFPTVEHFEGSACGWKLSNHCGPSHRRRSVATRLNR
jgi:hypothetical protein